MIAKAKKISTVLKLNGKEYNIGITLTHELKLDEWVNEFGKEINGDSNTIPANEFSDKNLKLKKQIKEFVAGLDFVQLNSIKRAKSSEAEEKLNSEGKATLIYEFKNIYDNSTYTKEVVFENLKTAEKVDYKKQHASLIQKITDKKIITNNKWVTKEEIGEIEKLKTTSKQNNETSVEGNELIGRVIAKKDKDAWTLCFGQSNKKSKPFKEIEFDSEFIEGVKKGILIIGKTKENRKLKGLHLTQHNGKWCIAFAFKDDPELIPYYVQIEQ